MIEEKTELTNWQPIETAPKDRSWILVWETGVSDKYHPAEVARFVNNRWESSAMKYVEATHWMPLPAPPVQP